MATAKKTTKVTGFKAAPTASRERNRVDDQSAAMARSIAGAAEPTGDDDATGPKVMVNVPRGFILTTDDYVQHAYKAGQQEMLTTHAEHSYSKANGVTPV